MPFTPPHISLADTTVANYFIPKGSHVILSRMGLGQNLRVWNDPNMFEPKRHLKNNDGFEIDNVVLTESELGFISFSTGKCGYPRVSLIMISLFSKPLVATG